VFKYETPNFYKEKGMTEELNMIMNKIYSPEVVERKIEEIAVAKQGETLSYKDALFGEQNRRATMVGIVLAITQQTSGINGIL